MDINTGILIYGIDLTYWLTIAGSLLSIAMSYRIGRFREHLVKKKILLTELEKKIREQEAKVNATDRDINRRVNDSETLDQRWTRQLDRITKLENDIQDDTTEQSKASKRMNQTDKKLKEAREELQEIEDERKELDSLLIRTRDSRKHGQDDLRALLNSKS